MENIKKIDNWLDSAQLICTKTDGKTKYDFNKFTFPLKFTSKIYNRNLTLQKAEDEHQELEILINRLNNNNNPRNQIKIKEKKNDTLKSARELLFIREEIISAFKKGIFPYIDGFQVKKETDEKSTLENKEIHTIDMPELLSEESAVEQKRKNKEEKGLKILTPNQMLSRLPITLAQLNAINSSEKLKSEIRQICILCTDQKSLQNKFLKV